MGDGKKRRSFILRKNRSAGSALVRVGYGSRPWSITLFRSSLAARGSMQPIYSRYVYRATRKRPPRISRSIRHTLRREG